MSLREPAASGASDKPDSITLQIDENSTVRTIVVKSSTRVKDLDINGELVVDKSCLRGDRLLSEPDLQGQPLAVCVTRRYQTRPKVSEADVAACAFAHYAEATVKPEQPPQPDPVPPPPPDSESIKTLINVLIQRWL